MGNMAAIAPYLIMAGGGALSGLFAPEGQEIESFDSAAGRAAGIDPITAATDSRKMITDLGRVFSAYADQPVNLPSSLVQGLPTFTGGGLPAPIGVTGKDPARANPNLLRKTLGGEIGAGAGDSGDDILRVFDPGGFTNRPPNFNPDAPPPSDGFPRPIPINASGTTSLGPSTSTSLVRRRGRDLMGPAAPSPGDDSQQAMAAVDLLMQGVLGGQQ